MASTLFISYRRNNGQFYAQLLHALLEKRKYNVFLDKESLHQGRFDEQIFHHIEKCDYFLLLLTPGAFDRIYNDSDWMRMEIEHAFKCQKKIIPIMDEIFIYPNFLPEPLNVLPNYQSILTNTANPDQLNFVVQQIEKYIPASISPIKFMLLGMVSVFVLAGVGFSVQNAPKVEEPPVSVEINANRSAIYENHKTIIGDNNYIYGNGNIIKGDYNKIYGTGNQIYGKYNEMYNKNNQVMSGKYNTFCKQ